MSLLWMMFLSVEAFAEKKTEKPALRFRDGKFRIAQLTDIHLHPGEEKSRLVPDTILAVLEAEKPDLVIMTGDIVTRKPALEGWETIVRMMRKADIPYTVLMGNHDFEALDEDSIYDILEAEPLFVGERGPEELKGHGNFVLPVGASDGSDKVASVLYCMDSGDYTDLPNSGHYAWLEWEQIAWYRNHSREFTAKNDGKPVPSLAFFHIAVPEYRNIDKTNGEMYGCNEDGSGVGAPDVNSGFLVSCLRMGDVMGMFVGHDHDNDYIGLQNGIALAYGRVSGFDAYGDLPRGARIIELAEGERRFDTWIATPRGRELLYLYPWGITGDDLNRTFLPAKTVNPKKQGLAYDYYEGVYKRMTDFPEAGEKVSEGVMKNFAVKNAPVKDHFAYDFKGYIYIPESDVYIFRVACDDGALLYIDGELVVDNGEAHSFSNLKKGKVGLEKGFHEIRVPYYENYMGEDLRITIESRRMKEQVIPDEMLFVR